MHHVCARSDDARDDYGDAMTGLRERAEQLYDNIITFHTCRMDENERCYKCVEIAEHALREAIEAAAQVAESRKALWVSHGGAKMASPYSHLTVEGECDVIANEIRRTLLESPRKPTRAIPS